MVMKNHSELRKPPDAHRRLALEHIDEAIGELSCIANVPDALAPYELERITQLMAIASEISEQLTE